MRLAADAKAQREEKKVEKDRASASAGTSSASKRTMKCSNQACGACRPELKMAKKG